MKKTRKSTEELIDPFLERELAKYPNPIPSREFILAYLEQRGEPVAREVIASALSLEGDEPKEALRRRLIAMERDGQIIKTRRGGYGIADKMNLVRGYVSAHKDGFGFVVPEDKSSDIFINARKMRSVFDGDKVLVRIDAVVRGRREGTIVEVLEHNTHQVVGRLVSENGLSFVIPENRRLTRDILIPPGEQGDAQDGQIVMVEILTQPSQRTQPMGKVIEVLGNHMAPGLEVDIAIRKYNIAYLWSEAVMKEVASLDTIVPPHFKQERKDLSALNFVTIDGEDAKDFDDAVYCEPRGRSGWRLYVAIADVSHYVKPGTALEAEAKKRANSVYFPSKVIPMLPEILSNGLCSLKPNVDRLCLVCEATINAGGKITAYQFYPAVIHSKARLTYNTVASLLEGKDEALLASHVAILPDIQNLHELYLSLKLQRADRGALEFETVETQVIFDENQRIAQIVPRKRNEAHRIIEECMLAANVCAARFLIKHKMPALYRIHAGPTLEKLADLKRFLGELGLSLKGGDKPEPIDYAELLKSIEERPDAYLIQTVLLRSLSQAIYHAQNTGHFGLAYSAYTHFTSPIRRYPDLVVHRAILHVLAGRKPSEFIHSIADLDSIAEHCSHTERRADEATRDALDWLKCEFMLDHLGDEFSGTVTGVTSFGLFIMLDEVYVEGLVHVTSLKNDYYAFDSARHRLRGERTNTVYRLSDRLRVKVARVSLEDKQIDFDLITADELKSIKKKPAKRRKKKKLS